MKPELSIIIPLYNESATVEKQYRMLLPVLQKASFEWELIFVNDGSTDESGAILKKLTDQEPNVHVVDYKPNRGRGYALRQGIAKAQGEYIVTTEFDLSYGVDIVTRLHEKLKQSNADVVVASPYMPGGALKNVPFSRAFLSRFGNKLMRFAFGGQVATVSGMTRGYRASAIKNIPLYEDGKEIHLEILSRVFDLGCHVTEIPATLEWSPERIKRIGSAKFKPLPLIRSHLMLTFSQRPLLIFGTLAVLLLAIGLVMGGYALALSLQGAKMGQRPITLLAVMLILFASQFGSFLFLSSLILKLQTRITRLQNQVKTLASPNH